MNKRDGAPKVKVVGARAIHLARAHGATLYVLNPQTGYVPVDKNSRAVDAAVKEWEESKDVNGVACYGVDARVPVCQCPLE